MRHFIDLTPEDWEILHVMWEEAVSSDHDLLSSIYAEADRKDAKLMCAAVQHRHRTFPVSLPALRIGLIDCGGVLWSWPRPFNLT